MIWRNPRGHKKELPELEVDNRIMRTCLAICPLQVHQRPHSAPSIQNGSKSQSSTGRAAMALQPVHDHRWPPGLQSCCLLLGAWPWRFCLEGFPCVFLWDFLSLGLAVLRFLLKHPLFRRRVFKIHSRKHLLFLFLPLAFLFYFPPFIVHCTAPRDIYIYFLIYIYMLYNILYTLYILYFVLYIIFICNST